MSCILLLFGLFLTISFSFQDVLQHSLLVENSDVIEDAYLTVPELITKYGYPVEIHEVQTEDGYILDLHRIPRGKNCEQGTRGAVIVQHGIMSSSADFIVSGPEQGLGYYLADKCYDVWLGNSRGNFYSKKHVTLDVEGAQFWNFSFHEMGKFDLPAMVDYVLAETQESSLFYIGHSQGCAVFMVFSALHPEYSSKIRAMFGLAPAVFVIHTKSPIVSYAANNTEALQDYVNRTGNYELFPHTDQITNMSIALCSDDTPVTQLACQQIVFELVGHDPELLNKTLLPVFLSHTPAGSSVYQFLHFFQVMEAELFQQYDYGYDGNMLQYGTPLPPEYSLGSIQTPIALYYGDNDWLCPPEDVQRLADSLPNLIGNFRVPFDAFNHLDFVWGIDAKSLIYDDILALMQNY